MSLWPSASAPPSTRQRVALARPAALGGGLWVGTGAAGQLIEEVGAARSMPGLPRSLGSAVTALAYAPGSGLWVGTAADSVYVLPDKTAANPAPVAQHFTTANGLLHNSIYVLLAGRAGRIWVGAQLRAGRVGAGFAPLSLRKADGGGP
ncbi:MAG: hypothetical protein WKG07_24875 [Hymenobacter sp.]